MADEFYMCQPPPSRLGVPSCASCCGVYNYLGHSRELVTGVLELQTELMESWDGTDADIGRVRKEVEARRPPVRFEVIYNCPFSGFLDQERTRAGCLLHPLRLGRDRRDYCRYGHRTCGEAKCSSYTYFSEAEAEAVIASAPDWYIYGLVINDIDLVKGFFELCENRLLRPLDPGRISSEPELAELFGRYLSLKESWPLARDKGRFGKYYFVGKNYQVYRIDYAALGAERPRHDKILNALGSVIESREELEMAIAEIDGLAEAFLGRYAAGD